MTLPSSTILIVDDNPANLKLLSGILKQSHYQIHAATSGEGALRSVQAHKPDIFLLDVRMPGMSGLQLCEKLKEDPETQEIPVIFLSALGDSEDKIRGFEVGAVDYMSKPFEPKEVLLRVQTHLELYHLRRQLEQRVVSRTQQLQQSKLDRQQILDTLTEGVLVMDQKGCCQWVNNAARQLLGLSDTSCEAGYSTMDLTRPCRGDGTPLRWEETPFAQALAHNEPTHGDQLWFQHQDGSRFPVEYRANPLPQQLQEPGIVISFWDISSRLATLDALTQAKERADEANRAKSTFLATMSHEIRTPMNAIIGMADLLCETELTNDQKQYIDIFQKAGGALLDLINDILDLAKVEANRFVLENNPYNLASLIEESISILTPRSELKGIQLKQQLDAHLPEAVVGDAKRLRQVLLNLLGNAIKFTQQGDVTLAVQLTEDQQDQLLFQVIDTGPGIPETQLAQIFDPFTQVDASTTRHHGGTGLGLAICKRLIDLMNGQIHVVSQPGKGSTFSFQLPLQRAVHTPQVKEPTHAGLPPGTTVLISHEKSRCGGIYPTVLQQIGCKVSFIEQTGAIETFMSQLQSYEYPPDILLIDDDTISHSSLDVVRHMRQFPAFKHLPTIMICSNDDHHMLNEAKELQVYTMIKPVRGDALFRGLCRVLDRKPTFSDQKQAHILLAEDADDNIFLIQRYLQKSGHTLDIAKNGVEAVHLAQKSRYDLILMDVQMPKVDGYQATATIRRWEQQQAHPRTPILALTAHALEEDRRKSIEAGCDAHLTKPILKKDLLAALHKHIKQRA
ncbi:response regulator [Magnetococcus sp. PR-3]|uniref:response regulator n=1 Tax=Magnetococcus sp. PR-3 TaxID=3120355 RepID=UPI002FCE2610